MSDEQEEALEPPQPSRTSQKQNVLSAFINNTSFFGTDVMEWLIEDAIGVKVAAGTAYERHFFTALGSLCMQHWPLLALAGTFLAAIAGAFMFRTDLGPMLVAMLLVIVTIVVLYPRFIFVGHPSMDSYNRVELLRAVSAREPVPSAGVNEEHGAVSAATDETTLVLKSWSNALEASSSSVASNTEWPGGAHGNRAGQRDGETSARAPGTESSGGGKVPEAGGAVADEPVWSVELHDGTKQPKELALKSKFRTSLMFYTKELMADARQYGDADKLALYGLFKQAKWGDCTPGMVSTQGGDPVGSVKMRAWIVQRGKPATQAMKEFIAVLGRASPGWESTVERSASNSTTPALSNRSEHFGIAAGRPPRRRLRVLSPALGITPAAEDSIQTIFAEEQQNMSGEASLQKVTLAKSLGPEPVVYVSTSLGVELEVQAGSLSEEMRLSVTVSPRLRFVECRIEGSDSAPPDKDPCEKEFLAMTFVHGPEEACFVDNKPAKLRYFMGCVDEFVPGDGSDRELSDADIEKYIVQTYRPLTSPNGVDSWAALGPYTVHFRTPALGGREVWAEIALNHFCTVANGRKVDVVPNIPGYKHRKSSERPYYKGDIGGLFGPVRRKLSKERSAKPMVRLGNATQEYATFTIYPRIEHTAVAARSEYHVQAGVEIVSAGVGQGTERSAEGVALGVAKRPITKVVSAGDYDDCEMLCDLSVHTQMNVKIGVIENLDDADDLRHSKGTLQVLDVEVIGGNRMLVLRPRRLRMPCAFPELPWPSTPFVIMNHGE